MERLLVEHLETSEQLSVYFSMLKIKYVYGEQWRQKSVYVSELAVW